MSFTTHYERKFHRKVEQFNKPGMLPDYFASMIGDKESVRIAEVGCALVNTIGDSWPGTEVEIVCSDAFADDFNALWEKNNMKPIHPIRYADVHDLPYAAESFDIVHCRNVLDHVEDPIRAIGEMKRVSSEWVYLAHAIDQMDRFGGHHLWNCRYENGECVFYGKEYSFVVDGETSFDGELVIVKIRV